MSLMTWTSAMSVGLPELDEDHRVLIRIINQLAESKKNEDHAEILRQSLYSLLRYAEFHFAREEKVLAACEFPGMNHHKGEHRAFTEHMRKLAEALDDGELPAAEVVSQELLTYLKDWLNHHILIEDKSYRKLAESNPSAREAAKTFRASEIWWTGR
jgi:hemerythrin-like metal-binding protein